MKKQNTIAVIIFVLVVLILIYQSEDATQVTSSNEETTQSVDFLKVGDEAPDFELQDLNGNTVKLSDFEGEPVIINFWATWCGPCTEEMPYLQQFYENYPDVQIITINCDPENDIQAFVTSNGYTFPVLLDTTGDAQAAYQIMAYPTTFVIDENGIIVDKINGSMTYEMMEEKFLNI